MQRRNSKETTGQHSANGNRFGLKCEILTKVFFNKNSDVVLLIFIQTLVRKDFCHVRCNWYSISEVGHISENGNKWSTTLVNHKPYIFFCENFPSFIIHTEKYREFQARFSLFFILCLTYQFRNGALSVTHQRMITITLHGAIFYYMKFVYKNSNLVVPHFA